MITALIVFAAVFLFGLVVYAVIRVTDRDEKRDPFAQAALTVTPTEGFADLGPMPAEIAHEEYLTAPPIPGEELPTLPPGTTQHADLTLTIDPVRYGHNLRYRYSDELAGDIAAPTDSGQAARAEHVAAADETPARTPAAAVTEAGPPPPDTTPLAKAVQAVAELKEMPADDYVDTLADATAYEDQRPFTDWERDSIVMPAIRGL